MEQRAIQRAQNRQIILERKRLIEEARQKLLEEAIENKRVIEEEERKKNLELITEMRKKELEKEKIRHALRERYLKNLEKAINFYNKVLIKTCFNELYKNLMKSKDNDQLAREHYKKRIYKEVLTIGAN
ncbi:hypothetical protein NQ317_002248 [Molorchus minor]|uniref:Uncharacterized protein n=1 Tax=Molorchus minor TaxID=1323400 RepID=A0ABQ9JE05_9CUCU|nr:hypothetical protein NQ317_002248 [Molorchus minor]